MQNLLQYLFETYICSIKAISKAFCKLNYRSEVPEAFPLKIAHKEQLVCQPQHYEILCVLLSKNHLLFEEQTLQLRLNLSQLMMLNRTYKVKKFTQKHFSAKSTAILTEFLQNQFIPVTYIPQKGKQKMKSQEIEITFPYGESDNTYISNLKEVGELLQSYTICHHKGIKNFMEFHRLEKDKKKIITKEVQRTKIEEYIVQILAQPFKQCQQNAKQYQSSSQDGLLVFNLIYKYKRLSQTDIKKHSLLLSIKKVRICLNLLIKQGLIGYQQTPSKTIYLAYDWKRIEQIYLDCLGDFMLKLLHYSKEDKIVKIQDQINKVDDIFIIFGY